MTQPAIVPDFYYLDSVYVVGTAFYDRRRAFGRVIEIDQSASAQNQTKYLVELGGSCHKVWFLSANLIRTEPGVVF